VFRSLTQHRASCLALQYHPFGDILSSGSQDCNIKVWDLRRKECIQTIKGHHGPVNQLGVSPDGKWLCSGSDAGELKVRLITDGGAEW
jgi:katanin p80 WD40 repeat-containing subunit B1